MNRLVPFRRLPAALMLVAVVLSLTFPGSAFFWKRNANAPYVEDFSKNGLFGSIIPFDAADFVVITENKATLNSIRLDTLPDPAAGTLTIGGQPLQAGAIVDSSALSGLRFQAAQAPSVESTQFTFTPSFSSGQDSKPTTVTLYLLAKENQPPVARNMDLSTYRNVEITGYFDAVDVEGDTLTFQLTSTPARGEVTLAEDGSSRFVYSPYENKTGSDCFTYVAVDPAGNTSPEAQITVRIEKADTAVTYADLDGRSAHKAAIRLAEEGLYVGQQVNGQYFFEPDTPVSRARFLSMAAAAAGLDPLEGVTMTGFSDDSSIPTWAKGTVSAALKAGAVMGSRDDSGAPVFGAGQIVTRAEATVMLNNLLNVTDVPAEVFYPEAELHWAAQAAANLNASGILQTEDMGTVALAEPLTMADAAELLDGALDLADTRETGSYFIW